MHDPFKVEFDRSNLSPWYYAVSWSRHSLQHQIRQYSELGINTAYDEKQLERLLELEQFLKMTWDEWMDSFISDKTAQEVK